MNQTQKIKRTLQDIAAELSYLYSGRLVVKHEPSDGLGAAIPMTRIVERIVRKKVLGIFPVTKEEIIFSVAGGDYGGSYSKNVYTSLRDIRAEQIVRKHFDNYIQDEGLNEVNMDNGLFNPSK